MKRLARSSLVPFCAAIALLGHTAAHAAVGIRVLAQEWNPAQPAQQKTHRPVDEPSAVSDALQRAWQDARPRICAALKARMGLGGAAGGFTLRDIDCVLDATPAFSVASNGPNGLTALLSFGGYLAATSTTPDHIDRALDPRFSVNVKMNLALKISVQPNPAQTLRVDAAGFTLSDARLDSHGLTGDVLKFVASDLAAFFTGTDYKRLAESAVNGVAGQFSAPFNAAFAPVNDRLRAPSGLVRVGVWARPDLIAVAFAPQPLTPPAGGSLSGVFRWAGGAPAGRCDGLSLAASVQTGPAPLTGVDGRFDMAYAPRKALGDFRLEGTGPAGECRYRLTGLATGWQNDLTAKGRTEVAEVTAVRNGPSRYRTSLKGDGWEGTRVTPLPSAQGNYLIVVQPLSSPTIDADVAANRQVPSVGFARPGPTERLAGAAVTPLANRAGPTQPAATPTVPTAQPGLRADAQPKAWGSIGAAAAPTVQRPPAIAGSALATPVTGMVTPVRNPPATATRLNAQTVLSDPAAERSGTALRTR